MERLVRQCRETGSIRDRGGGNRGRPFARTYTAADIRRLAEVDAAFGQMSGLATREVLRRQFEVFGGGGLRASRGDLQRARLQPARVGDLPRQAHGVDEDAGDDGGHRPAPGAGTRGPAGPCPRRHGAPGRPRRRQGHLPDQLGRNRPLAVGGHPVRVRRRRGRHLGALPAAAACSTRSPPQRPTSRPPGASRPNAASCSCTSATAWPSPVCRRMRARPPAPGATPTGRRKGTAGRH